MADSEQPIVLELTEEQQKMIYRMSGQQMKVIELTPDAGDTSSGTGRGLQFGWRKSVATGIPRQVWGAEPASRPPEGDDTTS